MARRNATSWTAAARGLPTSQHVCYAAGAHKIELPADPRLPARAARLRLGAARASRCPPAASLQLRSACVPALRLTLLLPPARVPLGAGTGEAILLEMHLADHGFLAPISLFWTLPCQRPRHDAKGTNTTHDASLLSPPQDTHLPSAPSSAGLSPNPTPNSLLLPAPAPPLRQRRRRPCLLGLSLFLFRPPGLISSHARPVHSFCPPQQPPTRPARIDVIACSRPVAAVADHGPADSFDAGPDRPQQPA